MFLMYFTVLMKLYLNEFLLNTLQIRIYRSVQLFDKLEFIISKITFVKLIIPRFFFRFFFYSF